MKQIKEFLEKIEYKIDEQKINQFGDFELLIFKPYTILIKKFNQESTYYYEDLKNYEISVVRGFVKRTFNQEEIIEFIINELINNNKFIAAYHYESGENEILNFTQFKNLLINLAEEELERIEDKEEDDYILLNDWLIKTKEIYVFELLRDHYSNYKDNSKDIFDYLELNVSDIYTINNNKKEIIV